MSEAISVALITAISSGVSTLAGILISGSLTRYRIKELEKKVEKHNSVVERVYKLEQKSVDYDHEIRDIKDIIYRGE